MTMNVDKTDGNPTNFDRRDEEYLKTEEKYGQESWTS
jgi:hypothetical protein